MPEDLPASSELYQVGRNEDVAILEDPSCDTFVRSMMYWLQIADEVAVQDINTSSHAYGALLQGFRRAHAGLYRAGHQLPDLHRNLRFDPNEMLRRGRRDVSGASLDLMVVSGLVYTLHQNPTPTSEDLTRSAAHRIEQMQQLAYVRKGLRAQVLPLGISANYDGYKRGIMGIETLYEMAGRFSVNGEPTGFSHNSLQEGPPALEMRGLCSGVIGLESPDIDKETDRVEMLEAVTGRYGAEVPVGENGLPSPIGNILTTLALPIAHDTIYHEDHWMKQVAT